MSYFKNICLKVAGPLKLTDSQIVLNWIHNTRLVLKQWVKNRVIEINRLDNPDNWMYTNSSNKVADIGARKGVRISVRIVYG